MMGNSPGPVGLPPRFGIFPNRDDHAATGGFHARKAAEIVSIQETVFNHWLTSNYQSNVQVISANGHFSATNQTETDLVLAAVPATERKTNKAKGNKHMDMLEKARAGRQMAINGRGRSVSSAAPSAHLGNVTFISRRAQSGRAF